jgi:histidyl-tRNA synthetase
MELRKEGSKFIENDGSVAALNELEILFKALEKANAIDMISFDLSLARGLDYYTGVIYEAVFKGTTQVRIFHPYICLTCYLVSVPS